MKTEARESELVFNIVNTPETFRYLQLFTRSLLANSGVRLRLVSNGCSDDDRQSMHEFASADADRVEVFSLSSPSMVPHGVALDELYDAVDDGEHFCFVDSDVKAKRPFMAMFTELLTRFDVVTSCNVAWSDDSILPAGTPDLVGRHAVGDDGFAYGSSYLAMYGRAAVERVRSRWGITFRANAYEKLEPSVQQQLTRMGRRFGLYDTAKVLNILLQGEGFTLVHTDNPALLHVGGISQYLSDPIVRSGAAASAPVNANDDATVPWHSRSGSSRDRWDFAQWAAATLRGLVDGDPEPDLPRDSLQRERAIEVRRELFDLAGR